MRFLHKKIDEILKYAEAQDLDFGILDISGGESKKISIGDISEYFENTMRQYGERSHDFIVISRYAHGKYPSLKLISEMIEEDKAGELLVLVGYADGGVISISKKMMPFQSSAKPAEWWKA